MNTKNILLTSNRSPLILDLVSCFKRNGHRVWIADSQPIALVSRREGIEDFYCISSPRQDFHNFAKDLQKIVLNCGIDLIFPIYEETFHYAKLKEHWTEQSEQLGDKIICAKLPLLELLHHKWNFNQWCHQQHLAAPQTCLITDLTQPEMNQWQDQSWILKPAFSRFASKVFFSHQTTIQELKNQFQERGLKISDSFPWLLQKKIIGQEYCSYAFCKEGNVLAHSVYRHDFTAGKGAGISFENVEHPAIEQWVVRTAALLKYTGHLCFDFIEQINQEGTTSLYPLECNPRATSGLHLLNGPQLSHALLSDTLLQPTTLKPAAHTLLYTDKITLLISALPQILNFKKCRQLITLLLQGKSIAAQHLGHGFFFRQFALIYYFFKISKQQNLTIMEASTFDIEWNGDEIKSEINS